MSIRCNTARALCKVPVLVIFCTIAICTSLSEPTAAVPLAPGALTATAGTTVAARPELAGPILYDVSKDFEIRTGPTLMFKGRLQNRVTRSSDGTLVFAYRIHTTQAGLNGSVVLLDTKSFAGFTTDVDYRTDGVGTVGSASAQRSTTPGETVRFNFSPAVLSAQESRFHFIKVNATAFQADAGQTELRMSVGISGVTIPTAIPIYECNGNGLPDSADISAGRSLDQNSNGIPDECEDLLPDVAAGLQKLKTDSLIPPDVRFDFGIPRWVSARVPIPGGLPNDPIARALDFLDKHQSLYSIDPATLYLKRIVRDRRDLVIFGQQVDGIPVYAANLGVEMSQSHVLMTNGIYLSTIPKFPPPTKDAGDALSAAMTHLSAVGEELVGDPRLMYFNAGLLNDGLAPTRLAWQVLLRGYQTSDNSGRTWRYFIDAHTGNVLWSLNESRNEYDLDLSTANNDTSNTCWAFFFDDPTEQWYTEDGPTDDYLGGDADADAADTFARETYVFFRDTHSWNSFDDDGEQIEVYVHVGVGWLNAIGSSSCLRFGDGMVTRDIFAHEFSHGIIEETSELVYAFQSGALDEAYADFSGSELDTADWLIGEGSATGTLRDMETPPNFGQPDRMINFFVTNAGNDNGGVHTNSGIINKVAFLLSDGGTHVGTTVRSLGGEKTRRLWFSVMRRLGENARFVDCKDRSIAKAQEFADEARYGYNDDDVCQVRNAFASVGLGTRDLDCDGLLDSEDPDNDGDSVPDSRDNCVNVSNGDQRNTDGVGLGDACDPDDDNDGILDDGDGSGTIGDNLCRAGSNANCDDNCIRISNPDQFDDDNDGRGEVCDDDDGDGAPNATDNCRYVANRNQANSDGASEPAGNRRGDACDTDDDNDGILDVNDSCPFNVNLNLDPDNDHVDSACDNCPNTSNASQANSDDDAIGDACDSDDDNDEVPDNDDLCPLVFDPQQIDIDENGIGLACDEDEAFILSGDDLGHIIKGGIAFGDVFSAMRIPFLPCRLDCPDWIGEDYRTNVHVSLPVAARVRIIDEAGREFAGGMAGPGNIMGFHPAGDSFFRAPSSVAARATAGAPIETYRGRDYFIEITPASGTPTQQTVPIEIGIESFDVARGDVNEDGAVDGADTRSFVNCLTGPKVAVLDGCDPSDVNNDAHVDLRDFAEMQESFTGSPAQ